jgi:hypothetical protein
MIVSWLKQGRWSMSRATYVWVHRGHSDGVHMICKETQYPGETSVVDSRIFLTGIDLEEAIEA